MIDILVGGIARNSESIEKMAKRIDFKLILLGVGLVAITKVIKDQNRRIEVLEKEVSELNTEGV